MKKNNKKSRTVELKVVKLTRYEQETKMENVSATMISHIQQSVT